MMVQVEYVKRFCVSEDMWIHLSLEQLEAEIVHKSCSAESKVRFTNPDKVPSGWGVNSKGIVSIKPSESWLSTLLPFKTTGNSLLKMDVGKKQEKFGTNDCPMWVMKTFVNHMSIMYKASQLLRVLSNKWLDMICIINFLDVPVGCEILQRYVLSCSCLVKFHKRKKECLPGFWSQMQEYWWSIAIQVFWILMHESMWGKFWVEQNLERSFETLQTILPEDQCRMHRCLTFFVKSTIPSRGQKVLADFKILHLWAWFYKEP